MFADIDDLCGKLIGQDGYGLEMLMFQAQSLRGSDGRSERVVCVGTPFEIFGKGGFLLEFCVGSRSSSNLCPSWLKCGSSCELIFQIFWTEYGDFDEEKFSRNDFCVCIIQDSPNGNLVGIVQDTGRESGNKKINVPSPLAVS